MENQHLDLGFVEAIVAEAFGEPGQRTFRLLVESGGARISLWVEKEQVVMLGSALDELLDPARGKRDETPSHGAMQSFTGDLEVEIGSLSLGYDRERKAFALEAGDFSSPFDLETITCLATRDQLSRMREQIEQIVAAGRRRCLLCGTPLTGAPHFCPESNGHARVPPPR